MQQRVNIQRVHHEYYYYYYYYWNENFSHRERLLFSRILKERRRRRRWWWYDNLLIRFLRAIRVARFQPSCHTFGYEVGLLTTPVCHKARILQGLKEMPHSGLKVPSKSIPLTTTKRVSERTDHSDQNSCRYLVTLANCDWWVGWRTRMSSVCNHYVYFGSGKNTY